MEAYQPSVFVDTNEKGEKRANQKKASTID
jgi:hypothetical protein